MTYWLDYEQGKDEHESARPREYLWNALETWDKCPNCGKLCGALFGTAGGQAILLDPDTRRNVGQRGPQVRAQEHRCR